MPRSPEPTSTLICYHDDNDPSKQGWLERVSTKLATMLIEQGVATPAHHQSLWPVVEPVTRPKDPS